MNIVKEVEKLCQTIYNELGGSASELNIHKALEIELREHHIKYMSKMIIPFKYKEWSLSYGECDFYLPEYKLIIELKTLCYGIRHKEISQISNYMRHIGIDGVNGLICNFVPPASKKRPSKMESYYLETYV
jgi:GxxExxY protein